MAEAHPLAEQCTATSKRTGLRCQLRVIGGGPCRWHGGSAPQVRAAREARILVAEAAMETPRSAAEAADVLTEAMNDAHGLLQRLKANTANGTVTAADLTALGDWIDRSARLAKLVVDAGLEERQVLLAESQGAMLAGVVRAILARLNLTDDQQALVSVVVPEEFRRVATTELPPGGTA